MKRIFLTAFALVLLLTVKAQQAPVPVDPETNTVIYEQILDQKGTADELYERALTWFDAFYPNARTVIQSQSKEDHKIEGRYKFRLTIADKKGNPVDVGSIWYHIKVWTKDGKYRYKISDISLEQASYFGIEKWVNNEAGDPETNLKKLTAINEYFQDLMNNLEEGMLPGEAEKDEDDW